MNTRCNISMMRMRDAYDRLLRKTEAEAILIVKPLESIKIPRPTSPSRQLLSDQLPTSDTIKQNTKFIESP